VNIAVIVPVWDNNEQQFLYTSNGLQGLEKSIGVETFVIDNGSPYEKTKELLTYYATKPNFHLIRNKENKGYGPALNQGLLWAYQNKHEYFICMNNDIMYAYDRWYEELIKRLDENSKRLVGPRLIKDNNWVLVDGKHTKYLEGWCLAFRSCFLEDVGFFDEDFVPAWAEDVDISWRAEKNGYELYEEPNVAVMHAFGRTGYDGRLDFRGLTRKNCDLHAAKVRSNDFAWRGTELLVKEQMKMMRG